MRRASAWCFVAVAAAWLFGCAAGTTTSGGADATLDVTAHDDAKGDGPTCAPPQSACSGVCTNLTTDPTNCGSCGKVCATGMVCVNEACSANCGGNAIKCSGSVDGGSKKPDAASGHDAGHDAGGALDGSSGHDAGGTTEAGGHDAHLEGAAADAPGADAAPAPDGAAHDAGGVVPDASGPGDSGPLFDAGTNPKTEYCADPASSPLNCGGCGVVCPYGPHSEPECKEGKCSLQCSDGYSDCDMNPSNGCEAHTSSDPAACGTCGNTCSASNAVPGCQNGVCGISSCSTGFIDCDMNPSNGCETANNTTTNCGTCGNTCPAGPNSTAVCNPMGDCGIVCAAGYADCDHNASDGCEVNTTNNVGNCGACMNVCVLPNATPACAASTCVIAACNPGFADCDAMPADGCEINLTSNPNHCSACGKACTTPNGTADCNNGACGIGSCNFGFANCPGDPADNCATDTQTNVNACGACGNKCVLPNATATCTAGACEIVACNFGFADCDHVAANGCEVPVDTPANCGACGATCTTGGGTPSCGLVAGAYKCGVGTCSPGLAACPGNGTDCLTNIDTDPANCGACGNVCETQCGGPADHVTGTACSAGACLVTGCTPGFVDFNGQCAGGCDCAISSTEGACANAATLVTGTLAIGQSTAAFLSTMAPKSVTEAFFTVTFGNNTNTAFHPKITITSPSGEFVFDVTSDCNGTALACATEGGSSVAMTTWEEEYTGGDPTVYPVTGSSFDPIPLPGENGQVWIRVYRKTGAIATCDEYTLIASE